MKSGPQEVSEEQSCSAGWLVKLDMIRLSVIQVGRERLWMGLKSRLPGRPVNKVRSSLAERQQVDKGDSIASSLTSNRTIVGAPNGRFALDTSAQSVFDGFLIIRADVELERRVLDRVGMVAIDPGALGHILATAVFFIQPAGGFYAVVPGLPAAITDVTGPSTAFGFVVLFYSDPCDASRVVVVRDTDVTCPAASDELVYGHVASPARLDFAAVDLAGVSVTLVEGVDLVDRAALRCC